MFRLQKMAVTAAVAVLSLTLAACGGGSGDSGGGGSSPASSTTLTLGVIAPVTTFEAANMVFAYEAPYGQAVYDTLLRADPQNNVGPGLATEWSYNADNTILTMTLRSDVTFSDGTKFDADVAAQNLIRFRDGTSPLKQYLSRIKDAIAVDTTHLEITLTESDPALLVSLTTVASYQESPKAFTSPDVKTTPVGSGPYRLDLADTVVGSSYAFTKNPDYWDKESQHYEKLVLKVYSDPTAMTNALRGKQLNGAQLVSNDALDQIEAAGYTLNPLEVDWTGLFLIDRAGEMNPALGDVKVRQAINYAIDAQGMLDSYGKGQGTQTGQIFPPSSAAYDPTLDSRYAFDPAKAKQLLAEAGYSDGFTLEMATTPLVSPTLWTLIQSQLKDVGITVNLTDAGNNYVTDIFVPKYPVYWLQNQLGTDWQTINYSLTPDAPNNPFHSTDPKVEELIEKVHEADTQDVADAAAKELNAYIVEQAWFAPWYRIKNSYATDPTTSVATQVGNSYPYLWNFTPKSS